jgi:hypothetical protein
VGTSFIIDGLHLKSLNQWYNKTFANIKEGKPQGFWSNRLAAMTEKRNRQMRNAVNKAARIVINHCIDKLLFLDGMRGKKTVLIWAKRTIKSLFKYQQLNSKDA